MSVRAAEFYSGIGGLHLALKRSCVDGTVARAFDWDQAACQVYKANHGDGIVSRCDISALSFAELAELDAQLWLLSPSCQPYTVLNPLAKGAADPRAKSFIRLIEVILPELVAKKKEPQYMLVENVAGFETSSTRERVVNILKKLGYTIAEFLLTPLQFGIPNSRLRYYLLAKKSPLAFPDETEGVVRRHIPQIDDHSDWVDPRTSDERDQLKSVLEIRDYIDLDTEEDCRIPDRVLEKWGYLFDIVLPSSKRSCCFTRGYTKLVERAGSVLQLNESLDTTATFDDFMAARRNGDSDSVRILDPLRLRYFSPNELLRLFSFQELPSSPGAGQSHFLWPSEISKKTKYKLLGNSVNVTVVSHLIDYLFRYSIDGLNFN